MRRDPWVIAGGVVFALAMVPCALAEEPNICPGGGTVRFGVEPYDTAARLVPIYQKVGNLIGDKLGCKVEVFVATSYNAEIEAMRNGKLEIGEFGPLGYVLAHQVAKAEAVAAFGAADGKPNTYWASLVNLSRVGHQDGRRNQRSQFRVFRPCLDLWPSVPSLWAAQGRARPRQRRPRDLCGQPYLVVRSALQP